MDQVKSVSESYSKPEGSGDANTGLIDTESSSGEEYNGVTPNSPSAVLGPDGAPVAGNNQNATTDYTKDNAQRDYVYDRVVEEVNAAPGEIERLSVAVAVDDQAVDSATIEQIENLVVAAAGIDEKRGDQVVVTRMPFAQADDELAAAQKEAAAQESQGELFALIRTALVSLALALMAFFAYRSVKKARTVVVENIDVAALNLGTGSKDEDEDEESEDDETQERLDSMSQMQPEAVAQVLKTWLADPRR
jgi:flagellar M-ring protein FliF